MRGRERQASFLAFWAGIALTWTALWVVLAWAVFPDNFHPSSARLVIIAAAAALLPVALLVGGRALAWAFARFPLPRTPWPAPHAKSPGPQPRGAADRGREVLHAGKGPRSSERSLA
jgi:hypothetical protein